MSILILVEHNNKEYQASTKNMISAALQFKKPVTLLIAGYECKNIVAALALIKGVDSVLHADNMCYKEQFAENIAPLVASLASKYDTIIAPATTFGKNLLPRISALLDKSQVSDVIEILDNETFVHPVYAGNAVETVKILDDKKLLTIRTTAFEPILETQTDAEIISLDSVFEDKRVVFVKNEISDLTRPDLNNAKIIVAGGRGLQSKEQFKLIEDLADLLGAAIGASRAAVDAGFVPNDFQVGQTGKIVAPTLYFAIGISGAIQHMAGMKESKIIVAINKDPEAPIFQIADYGIVGDLFLLIPELIEKLKQRLKTE